MRIKHVKRPAGGAAGRGQRCAADREDLIEQLAVRQFVSLVARGDEIVDEVRPRMGAPLRDDFAHQLRRALECLHAFRRKRLPRLGIGRQRQHFMKGEEDLLLRFAEIRHGGEQCADHELRSIILHAVEFIAAGLDLVEHAVDDFDDTRLEAAQAACGEGRHEQPANPRMPFAIHLGDELHAHEFVELLEAVTSRQLRREPLGIGKNFVHVRVATADDLRRAGGKYVERRPFGPIG